MRRSARFLFPVLLALVSFFFAYSPTFAQSLPQQFSSNTESNVENNIHNLSQTVLIDVLSAITCQLVGIDPTNPHQPCLGTNPQTHKIGYVTQGGGAIGAMGGMIAMLYTPPAHTSDYVSYLSSNFRFAQNANAASNGYGFTGISPLFPIWQKFANIVYTLFVLGFVLVGFAIMLRVKIDARTVMSIQNQIPKIIIGLVLVTLSYAIAGFLIDLMYVSTYTIINVMSDLDPKLPVAKVTGNVNENPIGFTNETYSDMACPMGFSGILCFAGGAGASVQRSVASILAPNSLSGILKQGVTTAQSCSGFDLGCWYGQTYGGTIGSTISTVMGWLLSYVVGILAIFVIIVAILVALFRIFFVLLRAYIVILLNIVLAPFWIFIGILPGGKLGFGGWLRSMGANLAAFPVAIGLITVSRVMVDQFAANNTQVFRPPLIGTPGDPAGFGAFIGLGVILLVPKALDYTEKAFNSAKFDISPIGQALGVGQSAISKPVGKSWSELTKVNTSGEAVGPLAAAVTSRWSRAGRVLFGAYSGRAYPRRDST